MLRSTCLILLIFAGVAAADVQTGVVRSGGQPIPGATVSAECGTDSKITTTTDDGGRFEMGGLPSTSCKYTILMFGFEPLQKDASASSTPPRFRSHDADSCHSGCGAEASRRDQRCPGVGARGNSSGSHIGRACSHARLAPAQYGGRSCSGKWRRTRWWSWRARSYGRDGCGSGRARWTRRGGRWPWRTSRLSESQPRSKCGCSCGVGRSGSFVSGR